MKSKMERFNRYDGLVHNKDGTVEFLEGGLVRYTNGANGSNLV